MIKLAVQSLDVFDSCELPNLGRTAKKVIGPYEPIFLYFLRGGITGMIQNLSLGAIKLL